MQTANVLTARVPPELVDKLRAQAVRNDRSMSAELRRAITAHVQGDPQAGGRVELRSERNQ